MQGHEEFIAGSGGGGYDMNMTCILSDDTVAFLMFLLLWQCQWQRNMSGWANIREPSHSVNHYGYVTANVDLKAHFMENVVSFVCAAICWHFYTHVCSALCHLDRYSHFASSVELACFCLLSTLQSLYLHCIFCGNLFWIFLNLAVIIDNSCISSSVELTCFCLLFYFSVIATLHLLWNWRAFVYFQSCSRRIDSKCAQRREASRCPRSTRQM